MNKKKLIIYGVGRFEEYASFVFNHDSEYSVVGHCIENDFLNNNPEYNNDSIIPYEKITDKFPPHDHFLFIAVGNNVIRERIFSKGQIIGYNFAQYISSKSHYWNNLKVGKNSFIGEGSVIQPFVEIGDNSILFNASIGHHCKIGDHTLLSSCLLGGNVKIGDFSFLGLHSTVKENTTIAERNLLGMGVVIINDTQPDSIYSAPTSKRRNISYTEFYRNSTD